jgi:hypothetical protein
LHRRISQQDLKARKEEVYWMIYNENLAQNESECIDEDFQPKIWEFLQTLSKIEVGNHKKYEHGTQMSRYNIFKGI